MPQPAAGEVHPRRQRTLAPGLPSAERQNGGGGGERPALAVALDPDGDGPVRLQSHAGRGGAPIETRGRMILDHGGERAAQQAHPAVDQLERRKAVPVEFHLARDRMVAQRPERCGELRRLEAFEVGAAQRVRGDAEAAEAAAQPVAALDQGDAAVEPVFERALLRGGDQRPEPARSAADDDGREGRHAAALMSGRRGTPRRRARPPARRQRAASAG
ncbi:MAG: hypothetical protein IBJ17_03570 [Reyranella sp.]|nr:hypothetical protein [Reyranella sp.]